MTLQNLKYIIAVTESGSITEASKKKHISQPSLSNAIKDVEKEVGFSIFTRTRVGIALTKEGIEFLGYARQVVQEMELLESRFIMNTSSKQRFCVSTQHYTFTANAFVELVQQFGQERFEFILNETGTHQIMQDVKNRFSDLGVLCISAENEAVLKKTLKEYNLNFFDLFTAKPHVFLRKDHPLSNRKSIKLEDLKEYPRLNFLQGNYESLSYAEEPFSNVLSEKIIRVSDRAAVINLMIGLDGYTISTGIFPKYLHGDSIISVPLEEEEALHIGYVLNKGQELSKLGEIYVDELRKFNP
ncbi:MAG: LysR family transcriptional regulator [Clostridia bacterium]|nr:LysR family transcriptional regulator [Lachnospiraceae bacterium]NCB99131.1 LysR family transcriptional regulator [Clostridia bacterium]NCD02187.1 LysR family transcriptional regulator [Clostridia bacterium]